MRWTVLCLAAITASACARGASGDEQNDAAGDDVDGEPDAQPDAEPCVPTGPEVCNGTDDDCNDSIDEGFGVGDACDSGDADQCLDDVVACAAGGAASECVDTAGALIELCNGVDDDCDPSTADGSADTMVGTACDGADGDLCVEGSQSCTGGSLQCSDATGTTFDVCNGADDDCDPTSADGGEDPLVGPSCDGVDGDLCHEGTKVCTSGSVTCSDVSSTTIDLCNGADDDCDPSTPDGSADAMVGTGCDGIDGDVCVEGTAACTGGAIACSDATATTTDLCNGADDDCDPASADGSEDPLVGPTCDGPDGDLCVEGTRTCSAGAPLCSDTTGTTFDTCNGADDDCDPSSADGGEDPFVGQSCDGADGDACIEGSRQCIAGGLQCSDTTGTTSEACNAFDDDCDAQTDEDFNRNNNPACAGAVVLGSVPGDASSQQLVAGSFDERWYRVTIREDTAGVNSYLSASVQLEVDAAVDFDLYVYCLSCGGTLAGSSEEPAGLTEWIDIRKNDTAATDTFDVLVEVRHYAATVCAPWTLTVISDTAVTAATCN